MVNNVLRKIKLDSKKIVLALLVVVLLSLVVLKAIAQNKVVLDNVILDINNSKDGLAIYIEEYDEEGNASYVESEENTFPTDDYVYNKELSGCLDSNSNEVNDALNYNYVDKELNLRVNKPVTCYIYYDYKGDGTEKVPYKIRSIEDLLDLSQSVNSGETYANTYFELTRDLDFQDKNSYNDSERTDYGNLNGITDDNNTLKNELTSGTGWVPIGTSATISFQGTFDGNSKEIYNFYLNNSDSSINNSGLFGVILNSAKIKNITLNGKITSNAYYVGSILANGWGTDVVIDNCHNKATVSGTRGNTGNVGGLVGGSGQLTIKNSSNEGKVIGNFQNVGGLIGYHNSSLTIENSYNKGTVETNNTTRYLGGLLGYSEPSTTMNSPTIIKNSHNEGDIIINGNDRRIDIGGLMGASYYTTKIDNSYNKGEINVNIDATAQMVSSGGLIGYNEGKTIITKSYNEGNIIGGNRVGGLVGIGYNLKSIVIIDKSYNAGNLVSSKNSDCSLSINVGGISTYAWNGAQIYIFNSYNAGNMEANSLIRVGDTGFVTAISGNNDTDSQIASIVNSYNISNISNSAIGTGFSILFKGTLKLNNVYSNVNFGIM